MASPDPPQAEIRCDTTATGSGDSVLPSRPASSATELPRTGTCARAVLPTMSDDVIVRHFRRRGKGKVASVASLASKLVREHAAGVWSKCVWKKYVKAMRKRASLSDQSSLIGVLLAFRAVGWDVQLSVGWSVLLARKHTKWLSTYDGLTSVSELLMCLIGEECNRATLEARHKSVQQSELAGGAIERLLSFRLQELPQSHVDASHSATVLASASAAAAAAAAASSVVEVPASDALLTDEEDSFDIDDEIAQYSEETSDPDYRNELVSDSSSSSEEDDDESERRRRKRRRRT